MVCISSIKPTIAVGLQFQRSKGIPLERAQKALKQSILEEAQRRGDDIKNSELPFIKIEMSCGSSVIYQEFGDIPTDDVPCPCGDSTHWLVRYEGINGG